MAYKVIEQFIIDAIDAGGYLPENEQPQTDKEKLSFLHETFMSEYGYNIIRHGFQGAVREWLQGLPSSINLPFANYDILQHAVKWGSLPENATEKQEQKLLNNYWNFTAMRIVSLWNKAGIK